MSTQETNPTARAWAAPEEAVMEFIRNRYPKDIDKAYDFYWEEDEPEEVLSGMPLTLGFFNFEDWMVCDWRPKDGDTRPFIDRYIEESGPTEEERAILDLLKASALSIYTVKETTADGAVLEDFARGGTVTVNDQRLAALKLGDLFGARILDIGGSLCIGKSIYPMGAHNTDRARKFLDRLYERYAKHIENPTMQGFLKDEAYSINLVWIACLHRAG
jgi:hypothetical protein